MAGMAFAAVCVLSGFQTQAAGSLKEQVLLDEMVCDQSFVEPGSMMKLSQIADAFRKASVASYGEGEEASVSDPAAQDTTTQDEAVQDTTQQDASQQNTYSGGYIYSLQQTGATTTSVTVSWQPAYGAIGYVVAEFDGSNYNPVQTVQETSFYCTYPEDTAVVLAVFPVDGNGAIGNPERVVASTLPKKINNVRYANYFANNNKLMVCWNQSLVAYGYEAVCYNKKGKVVQRVDVPYSSSTPDKAVFIKSNTKNIYYVVVRGYTLVNGGAKKIYGQASNKFYAVPQPDITSKSSDVTKTSINLKWKKVKGATSYTVYMSNKQSSGFKKVATVKKNSLKITKFKGKTLNTLNGYYIKVITNAKFKKKKVKSKGAYVVKAYSYYTY